MPDNQTHNIRLFNEQITVACPVESTILSANLAAGIPHTHVCGGKGNCSTCRVSVIEGLEHCLPRNKTEQKMANLLNFPRDIRLACQTRLTGDAFVRRIVFDQLDVDIISEQFEDATGTALGTEKKLTIVFTDIVNYTAFAEKFPPYDIVHVLNRYYKTMNAVIVHHHGIISDVAGDGILAVFGAEEERENSVLDALNAIQGMKESLSAFNNYLHTNFNSKFDIRAGIHFGNAIVGPFDTGTMKKLAVIGDNVNYASRIESANKEFGTNMLLSEEAYASVKKMFPQHKQHTAQLKGKTGKYKLIELVEEG